MSVLNVMLYGYLRERVSLVWRALAVVAALGSMGAPWQFAGYDLDYWFFGSTARNDSLAYHRILGCAATECQSLNLCHNRALQLHVDAGMAPELVIQLNIVALLLHPSTGIPHIWGAT